MSNFGEVVHHAEMPFPGPPHKVRVSEILLEPLAMGRWCKEVFFAVPYENGTLHLPEVYVPRANPCNIIPGSAVHAGPKAFAHGGDESGADHRVVHDHPIPRTQVRFERRGNRLIVCAATKPCQKFKPSAEAGGGCFGIAGQMGEGGTIILIQIIDRPRHLFEGSRSGGHANPYHSRAGDSGRGEGKGAAPGLSESCESVEVQRIGYRFCVAGD